MYTINEEDYQLLCAAKAQLEEKSRMEALREAAYKERLEHQKEVLNELEGNPNAWGVTYNVKTSDGAGTVTMTFAEARRRLDQGYDLLVKYRPWKISGRHIMRLIELQRAGYRIPNNILQEAFKQQLLEFDSEIGDFEVEIDSLEKDASDEICKINQRLAIRVANVQQEIRKRKQSHQATITLVTEYFNDKGIALC